MWYFSEFLHKLRATESLNIDLNGFFGENLVSKYLAPKGPNWIQNEVFQGILKEYAWDFLIFCMKLQQHKVLRLT